MNMATAAVRGKITDRKGFTLIEMLIVVAIIAILVAVSIPMMNGALEDSRKSTDMANMRSAKAWAQMDYMKGSEADVFNKGKKSDGTAVNNTTLTGYYDAVKGVCVLAANKPTKAYGQTKSTHAGAGIYSAVDASGVGTDTSAENKIIKITIKEAAGSPGEVQMIWEAVS